MHTTSPQKASTFSNVHFGVKLQKTNAVINNNKSGIS